MATATRILFYGYLAMVLGLGAIGIFISEWELQRIFGAPLDQMEASARATLLNHYRFLRSAEFGFGVFILFFRREILVPGKYNRVFVIGATANGGARILAMVMDGMPHWAFTLFAALELAVAAMVWISARNAGERS